MELVVFRLAIGRRGMQRRCWLLLLLLPAVLMVGCDYAVTEIQDAVLDALKSDEETQFEQRMYGRWIDANGNAAVFGAGESAELHDFTFVGVIWPYDWRGELVGGRYDIVFKDGEERQHMTCWSDNGEYSETVTYEVRFNNEHMVLEQTVGGTRAFKFSKSI